MSRSLKLVGVLAASALLLTGCAPGAAAPASQKQQTVVTNPAKIGKATLSVLDYWPGTSSPLSKWMLAVEAGFQQKYPNITIKRTSQSFDDANKTMRLKLSDPSAPDVVPANNGWAGIGALSKAHLILDLNKYADAYKWKTRLPATIARQHEVTTDGKHIGEGDLFGVPAAQGAFIAVYYNRAKLKALGLTVPTTLGQFESDLAKAKAAGQVPIQLGTLDQWLATTALFALQDAYAPAKSINDFVYGTGAQPLSKVGMPQAAATFQRWSKSGYLAPNFAGVSGGDAGQKFVDGTGVFTFNYSDSLPVKDQAQGNKFGTFLLPSTTGPAVSATGATQANFSIAANSKHQDAAALFLDYISGPDAGKLALQQGVTPFIGTYQPPADQPLLADEVRELNAIQKTDGFVPYFDWSSATMLTTLGAQAQELLAGKITPDQLVQAGQADYDAFKSKQH
jgi:raffinose/stachyose/melibiose transport system substrate-binding protein